MTELQARFYWLAALILVLGLGAAAVLYFTADDKPDLSGAYQIIVSDGVAYPVSAANSKVYVRELQRFGGKASVLFDELTRWFNGLWHGKQLGVTVGWISVALSLGLFLFARCLLYERSETDSIENDG